MCLMVFTGFSTVLTFLKGFSMVFLWLLGNVLRVCMVFRQFFRGFYVFFYRFVLGFRVCWSFDLQYVCSCFPS